MPRRTMLDWKAWPQYITAPTFKRWHIFSFYELELPYYFAQWNMIKVASCVFQRLILKRKPWKFCLQSLKMLSWNWDTVEKYWLMSMWRERSSHPRCFEWIKTPDNLSAECSHMSGSLGKISRKTSHFTIIK